MYRHLIVVWIKGYLHDLLLILSAHAEGYLWPTCRCTASLRWQNIWMLDYLRGRLRHLNLLEYSVLSNLIVDDLYKVFTHLISLEYLYEILQRDFHVLCLWVWITRIFRIESLKNFLRKIAIRRQTHSDERLYNFLRFKSPGSIIIPTYEKVLCEFNMFPIHSLSFIHIISSFDHPIICIFLQDVSFRWFATKESLFIFKFFQSVIANFFELLLLFQVLIPRSRSILFKASILRLLYT